MPSIRQSLLPILTFVGAGLVLIALLLGDALAGANRDSIKLTHSAHNVTPTMHVEAIGQGPLTVALNSALDTARGRLDRTLGLRELIDDPEHPGTYQWRRLDSQLQETSTNRAVVLVHGLDDPGTIWDDTAPALAHAGYRVLRFDYPNDRRITRSSSEMIRQLRLMYAAGITRIDLVGHSMGGLVCRDVLTRHDAYASRAHGHAQLPDIDRLLLIGTPNSGSQLARLRCVMEVRDQVTRWIDSDGFAAADLLGFVVDGDGQAGRDLIPGSPFLTELNARPMPHDLKITAIVGRAGLDESGHAGGAGNRLLSVLTPLVGTPAASAVASGVTLTLSAIGDGAVPASSAALESADEVIFLGANHRSLVRRIPVVSQLCAAMGYDTTPPAIDVILDQLDQ